MVANLNKMAAGPYVILLLQTHSHPIEGLASDRTPSVRSCDSKRTRCEFSMVWRLDIHITE